MNQRDSASMGHLVGLASLFDQMGYDKGQQIEDPAHIEVLTRIKHQAQRHRGQDRLIQAAPNSRELLTQAAVRGDNLGSITATLLRLLDDYGSQELPL